LKKYFAETVSGNKKNGIVNAGKFHHEHKHNEVMFIYSNSNMRIMDVQA